MVPRNHPNPKLVVHLRKSDSFVMDRSATTTMSACQGCVHLIRLAAIIQLRSASRGAQLMLVQEINASQIVIVSKAIVKMDYAAHHLLQIISAQMMCAPHRLNV